MDGNLLCLLHTYNIQNWNALSLEINRRLPNYLSRGKFYSRTRSAAAMMQTYGRLECSLLKTIFLFLPYSFSQSKDAPTKSLLRFSDLWKSQPDYLNHSLSPYPKLLVSFPAVLPKLLQEFSPLPVQPCRTALCSLFLIVVQSLSLILHSWCSPIVLLVILTSNRESSVPK